MAKMEHFHGKVTIKKPLCSSFGCLVKSVTGVVTITPLYAHMQCVIWCIMCMKCLDKSHNVMKRNELCSTMKFMLHGQADLLLPHKTPQNWGRLNSLSFDFFPSMSIVFSTSRSSQSSFILLYLLSLFPTIIIFLLAIF